MKNWNELCQKLKDENGVYLKDDDNDYIDSPFSSIIQIRNTLKVAIATRIALQGTMGKPPECGGTTSTAAYLTDKY